jgi:hypothetical protein
MHLRVQLEQQRRQLDPPDFAIQLVLGSLNALGLDLRLVSSKIQILSTDPDFTGSDGLPKSR